MNAPIQGCQYVGDFIQTNKGPTPLNQLCPQYHGLITYTGAVPHDYTVHDTGVQEVYWFQTDKGTARLTEDHRLLSFDVGSADLKLSTLKEIKVGDYVVASNLEGTEEVESVDPDLLNVIRSFVGEQLDSLSVCVSKLKQLPQTPQRDNLLELCMLKWAKVIKVEPLGLLPTMDIEIFHRGKFTEHVYHSHGLMMHNCASDAAMVGGCYSLHEYIETSKRDWKIQNVVHDSCISQVPKHEVAEFLTMSPEFFVKGAMRRMETLGVTFNMPLGIDGEVGIHW